MFRARPPSIFITYAWQCDLQKTHVWNVAPATQNGHQMSPKCCACHEKTQLILWGKSICACHTKRCSTHYETCWNVTKCHACHTTWSHATFETFKSDSSCRIRQRHSHTMRTVANGLAPSGEHTLNPQTPRVSRVKREPLLRIREKWYPYACQEVVSRESCDADRFSMIQLHHPAFYLQDTLQVPGSVFQEYSGLPMAFDKVSYSSCR